MQAKDAWRWLRRMLGMAVGAAACLYALWLLLPGETREPERMFCLAATLCSALALAVLSGRPGFGLLMAGVLAAGLWMSIEVKLRYLSTPLLAPDLRYLVSTSTLDVVLHYPKIWRRFALVATGAAMLGGLVWWLESPGWWRRRRWITWAVALLVATFPLGLIAWPHGPFRQVYATPMWEFVTEAKLNPAATFLRSFSRMQVELPPHASAPPDAFDWGAGMEAPGSAAQWPAKRPDLFVVLEESTVDPRYWSACDVPLCTASMFDPDPWTRAHGPLRVHTYGGGTWTSEFAFLTGLPHTLFGPAGLYAPFNLAPRIRASLPRHLKTLGYRTVAVYSMPRDFLRAQQAYADYGIDEYVDANDHGLVWESTDADLMRGAEKVLDGLRAKDDRPLFFMILTMRQHGPHDYPLDRLPVPWNRPPLRNQDDRVNRNFAHYLYRLHQSSKALAALRQRLFDDGRPFVLAHFGDHRPGFDGLEASLADSLPSSLADPRTLTYYRIDSSEPGPDRSLDGPVDIAFLGSLLLDVAGLPRGPWFEANARMRDRCDGRFTDCPDQRLLDSFLGYALDTLHVLEK